MYWPKIIAFLGYDPEFEEGNPLAVTLKNYRRKHGLKRKLLADRIGVDETTVLWWERGREVKYMRSRNQLQAFFETEGITGVEIPFYDAASRTREVYKRKKSS
ncbi:MAG: transcriptional regulator [Bacteroidota bacterium]